MGIFSGNSEKAFYELFERAGANMVQTAELFRRMLQEFDSRVEIAAAIREAEHEGDRITHETINKLNQTFITPLDREDIHSLATQIDEVVDCLDHTARRIILYKVDKPTEDFYRQAETAVQITTALHGAIKLLRDLHRNQDELSRLLIETHEFENKGDEQNHTALGRLFENAVDPLYVMKWKELHDMVEWSIDNCETVANTIRTIMVKNA
ncbi:MAG TPA: DUF47 family protein [Planctomycetota bacterium]|jgi:hypothetical protein